MYIVFFKLIVESWLALWWLLGALLYGCMSWKLLTIMLQQ